MSYAPYNRWVVRPADRRISSMTTFDMICIRNHSMNVAKHWNRCHNKDVTSLFIQGVEKVVLPKRGGDKFRMLCKKEVYWIFYLNIESPLALTLSGTLLTFMSKTHTCLNSLLIQACMSYLHAYKNYIDRSYACFFCF